MSLVSGGWEGKVAAGLRQVLLLTRKAVGKLPRVGNEEEDEGERKSHPCSLSRPMGSN